MKKQGNKKLAVKVKPLHEKEHKNYIYKTLRVVQTNKKSFKEKDIKDYLIENTYKKYNKRDIAVSGMGVINDFTMKYYDNDDFYDTKDYYEDRVEDVDKFDSYEYFDITLRIPK